jgi:hypothetical protein
VSKRSAFYPCPAADTAGSKVVSQAGGLLLTETVRAVGLDRSLAAALAPWRHRHAVHDPAKVLTDLAVTLAVGGDCLADVALLRAEPGVYGPVASDPTVSRVIDRLAGMCRGRWRRLVRRGRPRGRGCSSLLAAAPPTTASTRARR